MVRLNRRSWHGLQLSEVSLYTWWLGSLALLLFWAGFPRSPGGRGSPGWPSGSRGVMLLVLMAASARCRIVKVPDHPEALCFQIRGAAPPYVYAVGRGEWEPNGRRGQRAEPGLCVRLELGGARTITTRLAPQCLTVHHCHFLSLLEAKACECLRGVRQLQLGSRKTVGSGEDYG